MKNLAELSGKLVSGVALLGLAAWQVVLAVLAWQMKSLFQGIETPQNLAIFIIWSQPLMWLLIVVTFVLAADIARRPKFLLLSSSVSVLAIVLATAFLQLVVLLGSYAPIFELGRTQ